MHYRNRNRNRVKRLPGDLSEVLFEFQQVGRILRVVAIDPVTATEVIMIADRTQSMDAIKLVAARKLAYVLEKKKREAARREDGGSHA